MNVKWMAAVCVMTLGAGALIGAEAAKIASKADMKPAANIKENADKSFTATGRYARVLSAKPFQVNPAKKYKISGKFRAAPGTQGDVFYFGFVPLDAAGKSINSEMVNAFPKSATELAAPAKAGDKVVKVKDASKWDAKTQWGVIAFDAKDDLSDLPNRNLSETVQGKIENKNGVWEIALKKPLDKAYPAGTKVRQHTYGATYLYTGNPGQKTTADWKTFSGVISGTAKTGNPSYKWWKGTGNAEILIIMNYSGDKGGTEFKDILVEEL